MAVTDGRWKVLFAGGGTGGHLFPGITVARELKRRDPLSQVMFVGAGRVLEMQVLSREGFSFERVRAVGLVGRSPFAVLKGVANLPVAFFDAGILLRRYRPDLVVGLGGYSSGPVVLLAAANRVATLILEQNAVPGVTNRLLGTVVRAAAVSYQDTLGCFGHKGFVSGNPVRAGFFESAPPRKAMTEPRILVIGGSQGAHAINVAMIEAVPSLVKSLGVIHVTHQTGQVDFDMVARAYQSVGVDVRVEPFLNKMDSEMSDADVVVCRAGATTLAELAAAGRPSILVPYPDAANDHQRRNAEVFEKSGAAEVIDPNDLTAAILAERLMGLIVDNGRRLSLAASALCLSAPEAAAQIVDRMEHLISDREN